MREVEIGRAAARLVSRSGACAHLRHAQGRFSSSISLLAPPPSNPQDDRENISRPLCPKIFFKLFPSYSVRRRRSVLDAEHVVTKFMAFVLAPYRAKDEIFCSESRFVLKHR